MTRLLAFAGVAFLGLTCEAQQLFARIEVEPATVYAGQPFTILLSIFTTGQELDAGMQMRGLPSELQLQPFQEMPPVSETVNGQPYQVLRSRCDALCPSPGVLQFAPVIQGTTVRTVQTLFFSQHVRTPVQIQALPLSLTVKPIPLEKAPAGFTGLIGSFTLEATASTNRVLPGDLVTLTFTVSGSGRFDLLPPLGYGTLPGFKVYPARGVKAGSGARVRQSTQVVIPQMAGPLSLPALSLAAFNPEREAFDVLTAGPFVFEPDTNRPAGVTPPPIVLTGEEAPPEPVKARPLHGPPRVWQGEPALREQAEALFKAGADACENNRIPDSIDAYAKLLALGFRSPEVDVNLGAACARNGQRGKAMVFLLRAVRAAPRDALARGYISDVRDPHFPPHLPCWSRLNLNEWRIAAAGFVLPGLLLLAWGRNRRMMRALGMGCLALAFISAAGSFWWTGGPPRVERVVTTASTGRLGPSAASPSTARLDEGAIVRLLQSAGDWSRVELGGSTVWLPSSTLEKP